MGSDLAFTQGGVGTLAKSKIENLNAGVEEFDLEGTVFDWAFLSNELIEARFANLSGTVGRDIDSAIVARSYSI